jgi:YVTN family beta-propeller protein
MKHLSGYFASLRQIVRRRVWLGLLMIALPLSAAEAAFRVYVVNALDDTVVVFDSDTLQRIGGPFSVAVQPYRIAISPDGTRAYVVSLPPVGSGIVTQLFPPTVPPTRISVPGAVDIAITPDGTFLYVSAFDSRYFVIATGSNQVVKQRGLAAGSNPGGIAITPDGAFAYVTDRASNSVHVIDTATQEEVTGAGLPISVGKRPAFIAITPDGGTAYVTNIDSDSVSVIDTQSNQVVRDPIPVGSQPAGIAITPDGARAYVANQGHMSREGRFGGSISVIDTASNQVTTVTPGPPSDGLPFAIAIDQDGGFAYVANLAANSMSVINIGSNQVVGQPIPVGNEPLSIGITRHPNVILNVFAVWSGKTVFNLAGLLTTFTAPVDDPSQVASVTWDFYGDGTVVTTTPTTSTAFTYTRAGTFRPTVTVLLSDGSRASITITLRVQSPTEAMATTVTLVDWLELSSGLTNSLVSELTAASDADARGDVLAACGDMQAFENELHALVRARQLDEMDAAPRLDEAAAIRVSLKCSS